jgi:hypothetical protein
MDEIKSDRNGAELTAGFGVKVAAVHGCVRGGF